MDCLYGANHVPVGQISDKIYYDPYGYKYKSEKVGDSDPKKMPIEFDPRYVKFEVVLTKRAHVSGRTDAGLSHIVIPQQT